MHVPLFDEGLRKEKGNEMRKVWLCDNPSATIKKRKKQGDHLALDPFVLGTSVGQLFTKIEMLLPHTITLIQLIRVSLSQLSSIIQFYKHE